MEEDKDKLSFAQELKSARENFSFTEMRNREWKSEFKKGRLGHKQFCIYINKFKDCKQTFGVLIQISKQI